MISIQWKILMLQIFMVLAPTVKHDVSPPFINTRSGYLDAGTLTMACESLSKKVKQTPFFVPKLPVCLIFLERDSHM